MSNLFYYYCWYIVLLKIIKLIKVFDGKNKNLVKKSKVKESIFFFNATEPGNYAFVFDNSKVFWLISNNKISMKIN